MPELPITVNANITRIDAPFPEQWREEMFQFTKEIAAIKELMGVMATGLTTSGEAQKALAELYTDQSIAERASKAIATEQSQQRPVGPQGEETGVSRQPNSYNYEAPPGTPGHEREQQEREERRNPSTPPDEENILDKPISMPQHYGGKYTAQDMLILMGKTARKAGNEELAEKFGGFAKAQPNVSAAFNIGRTYMDSAKGWSEGLGQYAGSLGYEPGGGMLGMNNISGPFGTNFRMPLLNSGALSGISQTAEAYSTALTVPGLSGSQVMAMNQSLAERGWFPGQPGQQELFDSQAQLIGKGGVFQQLGEDPEVANLLDRAMRSGTSGTQEMLRTIEEIPEAAKHAHEGVSSMVQSMNEFGEYSQSQGGTHYAGQQQALELANMTGIPNSATKGLMESPWAQSAIFRSTGMPSWMQGTVPGAVKNQAMMKGFWSLSNAVGKGTGHTYSKDGFQYQVSGVEEQAARMHMLLPNINPETIQRLLREGKRGVEGRGEIQEMASAWEQQGRHIIGSGNTDRENLYLKAEMGHGANFGRLLKEMAKQRTGDGRKMFSQSDIKDVRTNFGQGYDSHGKQLLEEKYQAVQEVLGTKAGKDSNAAGSPGQSVEIELSPAARKFLQLPNKQSRIKLEAGAGENSTVNGFSGSTDPLSPGVAAAKNGYYGGGR